MSVNKFIGIGKLGKDPEVREMPNGNAVTNFSIAISERYKDKTGEKKEITEWVNIVAFGKLAEIAGQYLKKGQQVFIEGKLKTEKYEKNGQMQYSTKVVASSMEMLGGKRTESQDSHNEAKSNGYQPQRDEDFDDAIPF